MKLQDSNINYENISLFGAYYYKKIDKDNFQIFYIPKIAEPKEPIYFCGDEEVLKSRGLIRL